MKYPNNPQPSPIYADRGTILHIERKPNNRIVLIVAGNLTGVIRVLKAFCGWSANIHPIQSAYCRAGYRLNDQWQEVLVAPVGPNGALPAHFSENRTHIYMNSPYPSNAPDSWIMQGKVKRGSVGIFTNLLRRR